MDQSANHACLPTPLASTTGRGQDHEMPVEETSTPQKLPQFRYHPDPVGTGSIVADEVSCVSCEQRRPYTYTGPVYAEEELNEAICPWCIADGSAASRFDATFTDAMWAVPDDVPEDVTEEVLCRTPGFTGWLQEEWLHHCGDAAAFPVAPFPAVIKNRERASARRLQLNRIPLYQIHQPNPVVPDSVIMPGMRDLLDSGDIGAAGVSNYSLARWRKADAALGRPVVSNQVHFSLAHPDALEDLVPFAELENRIVIAYSPLAQGLLGGKYGLENRPGGVRALNPLFGTENLRRIEPLLATLRAIAVDVDAKPAQVALAWLISLPGVVAIPGASSVEQLEFNVAAADIELSAQSRDALTDAARAFRPVSTGRFLTDMVREKVSRR